MKCQFSKGEWDAGRGCGYFKGNVFGKKIRVWFLLMLHMVLVLFATASVTAEASPELHNLHIPITRPGQPYNQLQNAQQNLQAVGVGTGFTVQLDRHHVIPSELLIRFYNTVIDRGQIIRLGGFLTVFANNLPLYGGPGGTGAVCSYRNDTDDHRTSSLLYRIINNEIAHNTELPNYDVALPEGMYLEDILDTFRQFYVYLPGNLFIGPTGALRSDDPHSNFEENAGAIIGPERLSQLRAINDDMNTYVSNPGGSEVAQAALSRLSDSLSRLAARKSITQLDASDWVYEGRYRIKTESLSSDTDRNKRAAEHEYTAANAKNVDCILPNPIRRLLVVDKTFSGCINNGADGRATIAWKIKGGEVSDEARIVVAEGSTKSVLSVPARGNSLAVSWKVGGWGSSQVTFFYPKLSWAPAGIQKIITNKPAVKIIHDGQKCEVIDLETDKRPECVKSCTDTGGRETACVDSCL